MAYFNDKASVKTGVNTRSDFNLSQKVVCTQEISRLQPIFKRLMVPGDSFKVHPGSFHRLAPLPVPTYANMKNVTRAFFVPIRTICGGFQEFYTQTPYQGETGPKETGVPRTTNAVIVQLLGDNEYSQPAPSGSVYDFNLNNTNRRLNYKGKLVVNLLYSVGIRLNFTTQDVTPINLLPLFAYLRVYLDWYLPTQYWVSSPLHSFFKGVDLTFPNYTSLRELFNCIYYYECLEKDFFTTAWKSPNGPVGLNRVIMSNDSFGLDSAGSGNTIEFGGTDSQDTPNLHNRPFIYGTDDDLKSITQYGLDTLKAVQNFVNRDMIAGNRYIEQMLARFGVKVPDAWLQRSEYLGSKSEPVQISDVMSTADSGQQGSTALGDYAGKGISYNNGSFSYESKEFGYFLVINCIQAETGYYQGRDKDALYMDPFDYFTPEFDQIGAAPIRNDELFTGFKSDAEYNSGKVYGGNPSSIFGFHEQYYEYKNSRDYLLGDFAIPSRSENMSSYHMFRTLQNPIAAHPLALNLNFMNGDPSDGNNGFNRIFQNTGNTNDHFISEHYIEVHANRPMHGSGESLVTEGGRDQEMSFNGIQL